MKNSLILLSLVALLVFPATLMACGPSNNAAWADELLEATDPKEWESQHTSIDWITPDIVYVGHLTTELTEPFLPDDEIIHVKSTKGFLDKGWVKIRSESINYKTKTKNTFEGIERDGDIQTPVRNGTTVARLERGDYQLGDTESYVVRYHAGDGESEQTDMLTVTTWPDETKAPMPIKKKLASLDSVVLISSIAEELRAVGYDPDTNEIMVDGFKSDSTRILTINYQGFADETWYHVLAVSPDNVFEDYSPPPEGFEGWVSFSVSNPMLLKAGETREIEVSLTIPENAVVPSQRWMFWTWIGESVAKGTASATGVAVTWLVNMGR